MYLNIQIAIDGPAGSGKSTVAKLVSKKLHFTHIDSGAIYRAVTLYAVRHNLDISNESTFSFIHDIDIDYTHDKTYLNNEDVSDLIRTNEISTKVSIVATYKTVREQCVEIQRRIASSKDVVMEGRDIGSNVLKDAKFKFYLDADTLVRAKRRYIELNDESLSIDELVKDIENRDERDKNREFSPLVKVDDAIVINTSDMTIEEVVNYIIKSVGEELL